MKFIIMEGGLSPEEENQLAINTINGTYPKESVLLCCVGKGHTQSLLLCRQKVKGDTIILSQRDKVYLQRSQGEMINVLKQKPFSRKV